MSLFTVLIPARLAATRLPNKPLLDLAGVPMVVRVAQRALQSAASRVVVATDSDLIIKACQAHQIPAVLTASHHPSGSDRLAQACELLGLNDDAVVVNVQGDEPLIEPALINATATLLEQRPDCAMSTVAYPIASWEDFVNPNVVKVLLDQQHTALYFSRAPVPWGRDFAHSAWWLTHTDLPAPLRHVGIYGYRSGFLRQFPQLAPAPMEKLESLEQLRALWHGHRIAVHVSTQAPMAGIDTPEDLARLRQFFESTKGSA